MMDTDAVRELHEIAALNNLVKRYCYIVDDADWGELGKVFANDAVCDYSPMWSFIPVMRGLDQIMEVFAHGIDHPIAHYVTNVIVDLDLPNDRATIRSKLITMSRGRGPMAGEYRDQAVRTSSGWRLTHREAHRPRKLTELLDAERTS